MARAAGLTDVAGADRGRLTGVLLNRMLAMAIGAQWGLVNAALQRLAMHTGLILLDHAGVAHPARLGNGGAELGGFRPQQLVCAAVAHAAIGSSAATLGRLAVHAVLVVLCYGFMARCARRFGQAFRMRKL